MKEISKIDPKEFGLEESQAATVESAFMPKIVERDGLKPIYEQLLTQEITPALCLDAKVLRLKLVKVRTGISEIHKTQKAFFLAAGRYVDAWKTKETLPVEQMEENLEAIEKHFERIEAEKIKRLQIDRTLEMIKYEASFIPENIGTLTDDVWDNFLLGIKSAFEHKIEAEKAAIEAEQKRIEGTRIEQERIKAENERLKKEAEIAEAKAADERKAAAEKLEAEQKAAKAAAEKAAAEKAALEAELEAKAAAERKAAAEKLEAEQKELAKGDTEKVADLITSLRVLKTKYTFKSAKYKKIYSDVNILLEKVINHIEK